MDDFTQFAIPLRQSSNFHEATGVSDFPSVGSEEKEKVLKLFNDSVVVREWKPGSARFSPKFE